jgi:hypothetical protein
MRSIRLVDVALFACLVGGCSSAASPPGGPPAGSGGASTEPDAAATSSGGSGGEGAGGSTGGSAVGTPASADAASGPTPDASGGVTSDASSPGLPPDDGGATPMGTDGGPQPSYEGEIPIYYGAEVGPKVEMQCPGDPTEGFTEYRDSFHIERPYDVPINTRFSIVGGIYSFWVFPGDKPHSTDAMGRNPRTEAAYGGTFDKATVPGGTGLSARIGYFTTGTRMYSADMLIERNAAGSAIMQIHTTASGGGPIGLRIGGDGNMVNNGSLTVVNGSTVPGGLLDKWFNFKASLNAANQQVQIYINNCLKSTYTGGRGDGHFYFKNGVYFCKTSQKGCFSHYKNVHLYKK